MRLGKTGKTGKKQEDKNVEKLGIRKEKQENCTGKPGERKRNDTVL